MRLLGRAGVVRVTLCIPRFRTVCHSATVGRRNDVVEGSEEVRPSRYSSFTDFWSDLGASPLSSPDPEFYSFLELGRRVAVMVK